MSLAEIEAAAEALSPRQQGELMTFLARKLQDRVAPGGRARAVSCEGDTLLDADPDAPAMTPALVKQLLQDWP